MILPKTDKPSEKQEREAYALATDRDKDSCVKCGNREWIERDHRQNRKAGNTVVENLQCLCHSCHVWKTEHPLDARAQGFALKSTDDPLTFPARRLFRTDMGRLLLIWVVYLPAGNDPMFYEISEDEARKRMAGEW